MAPTCPKAQFRIRGPPAKKRPARWVSRNRGDLFQEFLLVAEQVQIGPRCGLAGHGARVFAQRQHDQIGLLRRRSGGRESGLGSGQDLCSFGRATACLRDSACAFQRRTKRDNVRRSPLGVPGSQHLEAHSHRPGARWERSNFDLGRKRQRARPVPWYGATARRWTLPPPGARGPLARAVDTAGRSHRHKDGRRGPGQISPADPPHSFVDRRLRHHA